MPKICAHPGCKENKLKSYGRCSKHYHLCEDFRKLNRKNQKRYREENRKWYVDVKKRMKLVPFYNLKRMASFAVKEAILQGYLVKQPCEVCGVSKADAHHDSYLVQNWFKVRWLCRSHHKLWHKKNEPIFPSTPHGN